MDKSKLLLAKVSDKIKQYQKYGDIVCTSFLDPAEQIDVQSILKNIPSFYWGGYEGAERKTIIIGIDYIKDVHELSEFVTAIRITSNEVLSHRSVLGSILGLGISRDKLGDILVNDNACDVILQKEIAEYVINNLTYVGREKVKVIKIQLNELQIPERTAKERIITVASLRLDGIISGALGISREKSSALIEGEKVNVNYKQVTSNKKQISCGDLISIRGYGRISVDEVIGESRSGRVKIKISIM